jgi:hypothetical protein
MKIVVISDVRGNYEALRALSEDYDELWVLHEMGGQIGREIIGSDCRHCTE